MSVDNMKSLLKLFESVEQGTTQLTEAAKWRSGYSASGHPPGMKHSMGTGPVGGSYTLQRDYDDDKKVPVNKYRDQPDPLKDRASTKLSTTGYPLTSKNAVKNLKTAIKKSSGKHGPVNNLPEDESLNEKDDHDDATAWAQRNSKTSCPKCGHGNSYLTSHGNAEQVKCSRCGAVHAERDKSMKEGIDQNDLTENAGAHNEPAHQLAQEALSAAVRFIQDELNVSEEDEEIAYEYFRDENAETVLNIFVDYIEHQVDAQHNGDAPPYDEEELDENFGGGMRDRPGSDTKSFDLAECKAFLAKRVLKG